MNIPASSTNAMASLAQQLFKTVDTNNDGKLNTSEFQSFLENLVGQVGQKTQGIGSAASAIKTAAVAEPTPQAAARVYHPMVGFETAKLNKADHNTPKYVFARATQEIDFGSDRPSRSAGLQKIADYAKEHGYPNTKVLGDDTMDFGDGYGAIDVLTGDGQWWWGPKA